MTEDTNDLLQGKLSDDALAELRDAKRILEHHGIADRLTELMGAPITASLKMLPEAAEKTLYMAIDKSLTVALDVAMRTLGDDSASTGKPKLLTHKLLAGVAGAAGGAFGGATIAAEYLDGR